jgi:hypothetical protein
VPRVFVTRHFRRWMSKAGLIEATLCEAVVEMRRGLIDADLGGHVVKKRLPLPGRGKRGGARTLVATDKRETWIFVYGFTKNQRDDVPGEDLAAWQALAADLLRGSAADLESKAAAGVLAEICDGVETKGEEPDARGGARNRQ